MDFWVEPGDDGEFGASEKTKESQNKHCIERAAGIDRVA